MNECPACHTNDNYVYIGVIHVECPNENCSHFSEKAATLKRASFAVESDTTAENPGFDAKDFLGIYDTSFD